MLVSAAFVVWIWLTDGFDVLHAANPPDLYCLLAAPFRLLGKKFVYDQHDLCPELLEEKIGHAGPLGAIVKVLERWSYKLASMVIVTNKSAYEIALVRGATAEKTCIVRNGPDLEFLVSVPECKALKGEAEFLAVYVGAMAQQDGVDCIVKAMHHIVHTRGRRDLKVAMLGDGDCLSDLKRLARALKVESYIHFAGWVDAEELLSYVSTAELCLAPEPPKAINQLSTFIKVMEYMSCGKATVTFDLLETRRTAGSAAMYVSSYGPGAFGDAILNLLDDAGTREKMGRLAAERVRTSLHWGLSREVLLDSYERAIWNGLDLCDESNRVAEETSID
jgi:glycosyltransferase involved in cell wall biosynthesis